MTTTLHHPTLGDITLSCSARARRISLTVKPSGQVRLSFPSYISEARAIAFLEAKAAWVEASRRRMAARPKAPTLTGEQIERLRAEAKATLPPRLDMLARHFGLRYGKVTIRAARSKWGSCSWRNNISLSLYLMTLPEHLRDYVMIHELCHTVHHDHSPRFHALVDRLTGGKEKLLARELRSYSIR